MRVSSRAEETTDTQLARDALRFLFGEEGQVFRTFLEEEIVQAVDALSRGAAFQLATNLGPLGRPQGPLAQLAPALLPPLSEKDEQVVSSISKLLAFLLGETNPESLIAGSSTRERARRLQAILPILAENQIQMRDFGAKILGRLVEKQTSRTLGVLRESILT